MRAMRLGYHLLMHPWRRIITSILTSEEHTDVVQQYLWLDPAEPCTTGVLQPAGQYQHGFDKSVS